LSFVASLKNLPSVPQLYQEIVEELRSDEPSIPHVTRLVQQDMAMTAKVLQIVNSAYFGLRRQVTSAAMAINLLGLENVRSIVLFANAFSQVDLGAAKVSLDRIWGHSMLVGRLAQNIAKQENLPKQTVDDALTAGLLHDCGQLVLLANLTREYTQAAQKARQERRPVHEVETELLGASHAEVGAYLLGIWGLPAQIVEAVAFHHTPQDVAPVGMSLLGLIHVANGLVHDGDGEEDEAQGSWIDMDFLNSSGLYSGIEAWRGLSAEQKRA
jgi:HD-like signal output (HDOD) protein